MKGDKTVMVLDTGDLDTLGDLEVVAEKGRKIPHRWRAAKGVTPGHRPWTQRPGRDRIVAGVDEIRMTGGQELSPVIEGESGGAPGRDPAADSTPLVEDHGLEAIGPGELRGGKTGHAAAENDKVERCAAVHLHCSVRLGRQTCCALATDC